jgi:hypothetical protein
MQPLDMYVYYSVERDGMELEFAPLELRSNKEIVLRAVTQNGLALQYASDSLLQDLDIVRAAVKQNSLAFEYVPKSMRSFLVLQVSLYTNFSGHISVICCILAKNIIVISRSWPLLPLAKTKFSEIIW